MVKVVPFSTEIGVMLGTGQNWQDNGTGKDEIFVEKRSLVPYEMEVKIKRQSWYSRFRSTKKTAKKLVIPCKTGDQKVYGLVAELRKLKIQ